MAYFEIMNQHPRKKAFQKTLNIAATYIEAEAGIQLRDYQRAAVEAIFMSVVRRKGLTIVVEMARQGGKNEVQAISAKEQAFLFLYSAPNDCAASSMTKSSYFWAIVLMLS